jgi:3-dehydroquinate dehydratase-1
MVFEEIAENLERVALAEIRMDLLDLTQDQLKTVFSLHKNLIATCRSMNGKHDVMFELLSNALDWGCAMIDVDIEVPEIWRNKLISKAKEKGRVVILSYHNFIETPDKDELNSIISALKNGGSDITKIACMANSAQDCARILGLYENHNNMVAFCMGELGKITRLAAPLLGAPFTYASVRNYETAPGQFDYAETQQILGLLR